MKLTWSPTATSGVLTVKSACGASTAFTVMVRCFSVVSPLTFFVASFTVCVPASLNTTTGCGDADDAMSAPVNVHAHSSVPGAQSDVIVTALPTETDVGKLKSVAAAALNARSSMTAVVAEAGLVMVASLPLTASTRNLVVPSSRVSIL